MTTKTTATSSTNIVVNAYGNSTDSVAPHFRLLVDGKDVGEATVGATSTKAYSFTAEIAAGEEHTVQVVYDNDDANSQYRDLYVKSVSINGHSLAASDAVYERHDSAAAGTTMDGQEGLWWNGALTFSTPSSYYASTGTDASQAGASNSAAGSGSTAGSGSSVGDGTGTTGGSGSSTIVVNAQGTAAGGQNAHFTVLADGEKIGEGTAGTASKDFSFSTDLTADQAHKIQVQFDNDAVVDGADRNLHLNSVTINGQEFAAADSAVSYDKGALDGKDVMAGQADLWWNGTLVVNAGKTLFTGDGGTGTGGTGSDAGSGGSVDSGTGTGTDGSTGTDTSTDTGTGSSTGSGGAVISDGYLHTEGSQIVDSDGNNVKLTGVNWFGAEGYAFAPQGMWQDSYQGIMDKMQAEGFNTIRLPWSDAMLDDGRMPTGIDYSLNPDLQGKTSLEVFDAIIDYADQTGMKIILDHHRSGDGASANENGLWYTDEYPESVMIDNWKMLAERYADNPSVVAADLHNEPHGAATWGDGNQATDWAAAAERIGNAIQSVNSNWLMVVEGVENSSEGTYWWGGNLDGVKTDPIDFDVDNKLVYSVHDYPPSMAGFGWFNDTDFPNNMTDVWTDAWGYIVQQDIAPVLVGEFGTKLETTQDKEWLGALVDYMDGDYNGDGKSDLAAGEQGVSWTYWAWSPGSGDTGGIMTDSWAVNTAKMLAIEPALYDGTIA